jgi:multidrug efflux pump subunit AcrA (membrane-fusion protein)
MPSKKTNIIGLILVLLATVGITTYLVMPDEQKKSRGVKTEEAKFVIATPTEQGDWNPMHPTIGLVEPAQYLDVQSSVSAKVLNVHVKPGEKVQKDQVILTLDSKDAERELRRLQAQRMELVASQSIMLRQQQLDIANLDVSKKQLENSKKSLERVQMLGTKNLTTQSELELKEDDFNLRNQSVAQAEFTIKNHQAQRDQTQASLTQLDISIEAQQDLINKHSFYAEFDGEVANFDLKVAQQINPGQSLYTLYNRNELLFKTLVASELALEKGAEIAYSNQRYGRLHTDPVRMASLAGQRVWFDFKQDESLLGNYVNASWVSPAVENSFLITDRALHDFDRVYYLQETENQLSLHQYRLVESQVKLHGTTVVDDVEYWVATSETLPKKAKLLSSRIRPLFAGQLVTTVKPTADDVEAEDVKMERGRGRDGNGPGRG